jgi:ribosomal-protein-alanine N-acetyltransferase
VPYADQIPTPIALEHLGIAVRLVRLKDARGLQRLLADNRAWLRPWEGTHPEGRGAEPGSFPLRASIRAQLRALRVGETIPLVIEVDGQLAGQVTVSSLSQGALQSSQIGYWIAEGFAGRGAIPTAVALTIDFLFDQLRLHRTEICLVPGNEKSLRVVEKLGMRYEGYRPRYIHINGRWQDHLAFAITAEEVPGGMLNRYLNRKN